MPEPASHGRWGHIGKVVAWLRSPSLWSGLLVTVVLAGGIVWGLLVLGTAFVVAQQGAGGWWLVLVFGLLFLPIALAAAYAIPAFLLRARRQQPPAPRGAAAWPGSPSVTAPASAAAPVAHPRAVGQAPPASAPPPRVTTPAAGRPVEPLSRRELEVLELLAAGRSNREIAEALYVAPGTVKAHLNHIFRKLEATSRLQAVAHAREWGMLGAHDQK